MMMQVLIALRARLIDDWRNAWCFASVKFAAIASVLFTTLAAIISANPALALGLIAYVPEEWRFVISGVVGALVFVVPTIIRLWKQEPKA